MAYPWQNGTLSHLSASFANDINAGESLDMYQKSK